jgi:hypothetical protein
MLHRGSVPGPSGANASQIRTGPAQEAETV